MKRTQKLMNNPVYLRPSILEISKIAMYEYEKKQNYVTWIQTTSLST